MKRQNIKTPTSPLNDDGVLADKALAKFNAGQYKEAIELYRVLLKQTADADWQLSLAQCYLLRAFEFSAKGMVKEALVLWENYAQNTNPPYQSIDAYIVWTLQSNNTAKTKSYLSKLSAKQLDEQYPELASLLGFLIITAKSDLKSMLASDSILLTHSGFAQEALTAYRNNDREGVEQALQKLPFRSAFRDLRTLIKASMLFAESTEQTCSLLGKIVVTSPYRLAAELLLATVNSGAGLVTDLLQFTPPQVQIIAAAKSLNKKQAELLDVLNKQQNRLTDKLKFNLALKYQTLFDRNTLQDYCLKLVSTSYTVGKRDYIKHFGDVDKFEENRLHALSCEASKNSYDAEYYWMQCIGVLKNQGVDNSYKIALILRHLAEKKDNVKKSASFLIDSLEYDSDDLETYITILHCFENEKQQSDNFKQWLDKSIKKFPQDIDVLTLAIKASVRNKAFKKATQYAQTILKIDPVNTSAKQVLFSSHLAHVRKLIKTKKFHLVEKEIQQAETVTISKRHQALAAIMRGFYVFAAEDKKQGALQIASTVQKLNDGLFKSHFFVTMEALLLDLPVTTVLKELPPLPKNSSLSGQELLDIVKLIYWYDDEDSSNRGGLQKTLDKFKTIIRQSLKQATLNEDQLLILCECFARIQHFGFLDFCVKLAFSVSSVIGKPIWQYYRIFAKAKGDPGKCFEMDVFILQNEFVVAREQNDERTAMLIKSFVDEYYELDDIFDDDEDDEYGGGDLEELFSHLPDNIFRKLEPKLIELTMKYSRPEKLLKELAAQFLSNDEARLENIIEARPDALLAFLMLKAAAELGIDTGVTPEDVIKCCTSSQY